MLLFFVSIFVIMGHLKYKGYKMHKYFKIIIGVVVILFIITTMNVFTEGLQAQELSHGDYTVARLIGYSIFLGLIFLIWKNLVSNKKHSGKED